MKIMKANKVNEHLINIKDDEIIQFLIVYMNNSELNIGASKL